MGQNINIPNIMEGIIKKQKGIVDRQISYSK